jgi:HlyD family secretion protein
MPKKALIALLAVVLISVALVWRVRAEDAKKHAPSGGSATVEGTNVLVGSKTSGRIVDLPVNEGDRVQRGQLIARLDCREQQAQLAAAKARLGSAEVQVRVAEAAYRGAKGGAVVAAQQTASVESQERAVAIEREQTARDAQRTAQLLRAGATSRAEEERWSTRLRGAEESEESAKNASKTARISANTAHANAETVRTQIDLARAGVDSASAEVERANVAVEECSVLAPRDGVITSKLLEAGAVVLPGARIVELIDLSTAKLTFFLPNAELGRAKLDAPAEVRVDAFPGRVFQGRVRRIASEAEFTPRNVQTREDRDRLVFAVEIQVPNADGTLRAGMPADVSLPGTSP